MKLKRRQLLDMGAVLMSAEQIFKAPIKGKFYYACMKNRAVAQEEYKLSTEANPYPEQYSEYDNKRVAIINEVGETVREGFGGLSIEERDSIINSRDPKVMPADKHDLLISRLNDLNKEYKDLLDEVAQIDQKRNEFLDEEDEYVIKTVKPDEIPEIVGGNGWLVYAALEPMISEG